MRTPKLAVLSIICLCSALSCAQSLGEVAKQKPAKKATRVITNDEIPSRPPEEEPKKADPKPEASADEEKPAKESSTPAATTDAASAEQSSPEIQGMEKQLADLKSNLEARQKRTDEYREKLKAEADDSRRDVQQGVLDGMESDLKSMQKSVDDLQKQIDDKKAEKPAKPKESDGQ